MRTLVIGGSGSGKSAFAEKKIVLCGQKKRYYIATMQPCDEESRERVKKHRQQRAALGFATIECPTHLETISLPDGSAALLEDVSNLLANERFSPDGRKEDAARMVLAGIRRLFAAADDVVVVTNAVCADGRTYDRQTQSYLADLSRVNAGIAAMADEAYEVVCGIPVAFKRPKGN